MYLPHKENQAFRWNNTSGYGYDPVWTLVTSQFVRCKLVTIHSLPTVYSTICILYTVKFVHWLQHSLYTSLKQSVHWLQHSLYTGSTQFIHWLQHSLYTSLKQCVHWLQHSLYTGSTQFIHWIQHSFYTGSTQFIHWLHSTVCTLV